MQNDTVEKIRNHPKYKELVSKRSSFGMVLSILMLTAYYAFILVIAFNPKLLAIKIAEGSVISVGIPVGILLILFSFALTGIYVVRANGEFDRLNNEIKEEFK